MVFFIGCSFGQNCTILFWTLVICINCLARQVNSLHCAWVSKSKCSYQVRFVYSSASLPLVIFKTKNYFPSKAEKPVYAGACSPALKTNTVLAWIIGDCFLVHVKVSHNQKASSSFFLRYHVQIVLMCFSTVQSQQVYFLNRDGIRPNSNCICKSFLALIFMSIVSHGWYFTKQGKREKNKNTFTYSEYHQSVMFDL